MPLDLAPYRVEGAVWLGNLNQTASKPVIIRARDNLFYLCKARWLNPAEPYTPANELLAALLANYLGLPIPNFKIVHYLGETYFGSQMHQIYPFNPASIAYPQVLADVFAFDVWTCNSDRHLGNFVSIQPVQGQTALMVIDHGRTFYGEAADCGLWDIKLKSNDISAFVRAAPNYQNCINRFEDFSSALAKIETFPEDVLRDCALGNFYLTPDEANVLFADLRARQPRVRDLLYANRALFGLP